MPGAILLDIERIGPCMPGATIESVDGDDFTGNVKVKLGPINLTYKGKASFVEKDEDAHRAVIDARGRDARGNGTAAAKVTATLAESGGRDHRAGAHRPRHHRQARAVRPRRDGRRRQQADRPVRRLPGQHHRPQGDAVDAVGRTASAPARRPRRRRRRPEARAAKKADRGQEGTRPRRPPAKKRGRRREQAARPQPGPAGDHGRAADAPISRAAPSRLRPTAAVPTERRRERRSTYAQPSTSAPEPGEEPSVNGHASATPHPQREAEPIDLLQSAGPAVASGWCRCVASGAPWPR